jgi:hypothetical protein
MEAAAAKKGKTISDAEKAVSESVSETRPNWARACS